MWLLASFRGTLMHMSTTREVRYATKKGEDYDIRFVEKLTPLRNTWFIFEVKNLADHTITQQGVSFGRLFVKTLEGTKGGSDKQLCALALLRLKIALERQEPDATANRPRPLVDCGYDLHDAAAEEHPVSMEAETIKFQGQLRRARRNKTGPVASLRRVGLQYGGVRQERRRIYGF
jgi:hypothetical protein